MMHIASRVSSQINKDCRQPYALATGPGRGPQIRYQYFVDEGAMLVNKEGKRFVNESLAPTLISPSMERNSDKSMYLLMTTDQFERATKKYPFGALLSSPQWTRARWDTELAKSRVIVQGNTIEEAAKKVSEWNQTVASGRDLKFGRTKFAGKFEGTHFFMAKINVWVCLSMGGFNVDKHLQVLGWNDQPVGGLYAAGETVGGIHGAHYLGGRRLWLCSYVRICDREAADWTESRDLIVVLWLTA